MSDEQLSQTEAVAKSAANLRKLIDELNAPSEIDGEKFDSEFDFKLVDEGGRLYLYDAKENYTINYEEDVYNTYQEIADEFGADASEATDTVTPRIKDAVKKDFGKDAYIEWEDSVKMIIVKDKDESIDKAIDEDAGTIDSDALKEIRGSGLDFIETKNEDGNTFLIISDWENVRRIQKIINPEFEPDGFYDTDVLDNLKDIYWGFADEWGICDECGKLIRTSPDSYSFVPDYWVSEHAVLCGDCVRNNHASEYAQSLVGDSSTANTILSGDDLEKLGFTLIDKDFEFGWYDAHDSPKEILKTALEKHPEGAFLFSISSQGQFATQFELWGADIEEKAVSSGEVESLKEDEEEHDNEHIDADSRQVYEFPSEFENYLPELEKLCEEHDIEFLGKGKNVIDDTDELDFFVEGRYADLVALADEIDYDLHPDYLCDADDFDSEDILVDESATTVNESLKEAAENEKGFTEEEAGKFAKELTQKFFDNGGYYDIWSTGGEIETQIDWGDWKHDHLYFRNTVQKFFDALGIGIDIESEVTEEDGSDAYSVHYTITKA